MRPSASKRTKFATLPTEIPPQIRKTKHKLQKQEKKGGGGGGEKHKTAGKKKKIKLTTGKSRIDELIN